jgi:hypothetical protein
MTIGANLNGGSLTIGANNATTSINSNVTNVATGGLTGSGRVNIGSGTNLDGSQLYLGSSTLYQSYIRAKLLSINDIGNTTTYIGTGGLSGSDRVFIASGANAVGSEMYLGSASLYQSFIRGTIINIADNGGTVNLANNGLPASGSINIAGGASGANAIIQMGSNSLSTLYLRSKFVNIAENQTGSNNFVIIGTTGISNVYLKGASVNLADDGGNVTIGKGDGTSVITMRSPITPIYPISFTSGQIGYSSSSTISGALVSATYNTLIAPTLSGVYMTTTITAISGGTFTGINNYDLQVGLNGVGVKTRSSLDGANITLQVYTQTVPYVYSSGGTANPTSAGLYTSVYVYFPSATGTPIYTTTLFYTRVA